MLNQTSAEFTLSPQYPIKALGTNCTGYRSTEELGGKDGECTFPFVYKNVTYHMCTYTNAEHAWCSLFADYVTGQFGWCPGECLTEGRGQ